MITVSEMALKDAAFDVGLEEGDLRLDYSGRGMYGDTCVGVVHDDPATPGLFLAKLAGYAAAHGNEVTAEQLLELSASGDSMGLSAITYWRGLQVES